MIYSSNSITRVLLPLNVGRKRKRDTAEIAPAMIYPSTDSSFASTEHLLGNFHRSNDQILPIKH